MSTIIKDLFTNSETSGVRIHSSFKDCENIIILMNTLSVKPYLKDRAHKTPDDILAARLNEIDRLSKATAAKPLELDNVNFNYYYTISVLRENNTISIMNFSNLLVEGFESFNKTELDEERANKINTFASPVDSMKLTDFTGMSHGEIWKKFKEIYTLNKCVKSELSATVHIQFIEDVFTKGGVKQLDENGKHIAILNKRVWLEF